MRHQVVFGTVILILAIVSSAFGQYGIPDEEDEAVSSFNRQASSPMIFPNNRNAKQLVFPQGSWEQHQRQKRSQDEVIKKIKDDAKGPSIFTLTTVSDADSKMEKLKFVEKTPTSNGESIFEFRKPENIKLPVLNFFFKTDENNNGRFSIEAISEDDKKKDDTEKPMATLKSVYTYKGEDGKSYIGDLQWTAGDNGFKATGTHLPVVQKDAA